MKLIKHLRIIVTSILLFPIYACAQFGGGTGGIGVGTPGGGGTIGGGGGPQLPNPITTTNIADLLDHVIKILTFTIAPPIAVFMVIYGAFQILGAGGSEDKIKSGRKTLLWTAVGFGILLLAKLISALVKEVLGVKS